MESKHTNFTWNYQKVEGTVDDYEVIAGGGTKIATIHSRDKIGESEANAKLVNQSPVMYQLLRETLEGLNDKEGRRSIWEDAQKLAIETIFKELE